MSDMLKKSQKNNASEKCVKSDNITELWKEGKLPEGWYYVKLKISDVIEIDRCMINYGKMFRYSYFENETEISEVLAPVPSYDEWKNTTSSFGFEHKANIELIKENEKLKHTLQKARIYVAIDAEDYEDRTPSKAEKAEAKKLLTEIDEVLR